MLGKKDGKGKDEKNCFLERNDYCFEKRKKTFRSARVNFKLDARLENRLKFRAKNFGYNCFFL